jgi:hypothetical protein
MLASLETDDDYFLDKMTLPAGSWRTGMVIVTKWEQENIQRYCLVGRHDRSGSAMIGTNWDLEVFCSRGSKMRKLVFGSTKLSMEFRRLGSRTYLGMRTRIYVQQWSHFSKIPVPMSLNGFAPGISAEPFRTKSIALVAPVVRDQALLLFERVC